MYFNEICFALAGAVGVITLSLFTMQIARYFVGFGAFSAFFLLFLFFTGSTESSLFLSIGAEICFAWLFDWALQNDIYSLLLLVIVAVIGTVAATIFLADLWHYSRLVTNILPSDSDTIITPQKIIQLYKELIHILQQL